MSSTYLHTKNVPNQSLSPTPHELTMPTKHRYSIWTSEMEDRLIELGDTRHISGDGWLEISQKINREFQEKTSIKAIVGTCGDKYNDLKNKRSLLASALETYKTNHPDQAKADWNEILKEYNSTAKKIKFQELKTAEACRALYNRLFTKAVNPNLPSFDSSLRTNLSKQRLETRLKERNQSENPIDTVEKLTMLPKQDSGIWTLEMENRLIELGDASHISGDGWFEISKKINCEFQEKTGIKVFIYTCKMKYLDFKNTENLLFNTVALYEMMFPNQAENDWNEIVKGYNSGSEVFQIKKLESAEECYSLYNRLFAKTVNPTSSSNSTSQKNPPKQRLESWTAERNQYLIKVVNDSKAATGKVKWGDIAQKMREFQGRENIDGSYCYKKYNALTKKQIGVS